jgi:capsular polysaccharide biosynthesis protein
MLSKAERDAWTRPVRYLDPTDMACVDGRALVDAGDGSPTIYWEHSASRWRRFLRYATEFIDDPDGCGWLSRIGSQVYLSPPGFVAVTGPAAVVGYRTVLSNGRFFNDDLYGPEDRADFLDTLAKSDPFPNEETRLRRTDDADVFRLEDADQDMVRYPGSAILLGSHEASNYGSFLFRVLPKAHIVRELGLTSLPIVCWDFGDSTRALLECAGLDPALHVPHESHRVTVYDRLFVPSLRNPNALLDHESRALYRRIRRHFGSRERGRLLYVSRLAYNVEANHGRRMVNEAELIERLRELGFEIVEPQNLTMREQIEMFSSAELVVGPSGSAMFNVVFCEPGTKVIDIESEPHWIYAHAGLFASCELRYGVFIGAVDAQDPAHVHRRFTVNIDALVERIQDFLDR